MGASEGFLANLVDVVVANFGSFYPELLSSRNQIFDIVQEEEASFSKTLARGIERFKKAAANSSGKILDGYVEQYEPIKRQQHQSPCCLDPLSFSVSLEDNSATGSKLLLFGIPMVSLLI